MKKARKGFTLVELLIVIAIIGILGAMSMMGGSEANSIAQANKIIEEFKIIGAAMHMYYADNRSGVEKELAPAVEANQETGTEAQEAETLPGRIKLGIAAYMKNTDSVAVADSGTTGKYIIVVPENKPSEWWLLYTLPEANTKVAKILENKATDAGLYASTDENTSEGATNPYKSTAVAVY